MRKIIVDLGKRSYHIYIEAGIIKKIGALCEQHNVAKKVVLITDKTVKNLYADEVICKLENSNYSVLTITVPVGELSKSLKIADNVFEKMITGRIDRQASIIALGGGVVGDLAGFVAATYMRGISYIQIPTTLLAQTDSSVGGKVGINHRLGKNLIGAFYQPQFVVIDPLVLKTLDSRDIISGLGEVIKYGLIWDENLFKKVFNNFEKLTNKIDTNYFEEVIEKCCRIKAEVVAKDEKEAGLRRILNFGHTIGHALEAATNYEYYRHGEAVILGMMAMSWLSNELHLLTKEEFDQINNFWDRLPNINIPAEISSKEILGKVYFDKKIIQNKLCVVLLKKIGETIIQNNFDEKQLLRAIDYLLKNRN